MTDMKDSLLNMQNQMQSAYANLAKVMITGESSDKSVKITMSATYEFGDIEFDEAALKGGLKEFRWRVREAWKNLTKNIQETTQTKTLELLQGMEIPEDIKKLSEQSGDDDN